MGAGSLSGVRPQLIRDVLLRDGTALRLRAPEPRDFEDIKRFYDGLSDESRYMRFHGFGRTDVAARQSAEADGIDRVALIARHEGRVVAAASYDGLREPGAAEVAFAVADDFQAKGTATRLLEQLAAVGAGRGLRRFDAEVLGENRKMLRVFTQAGFALRRRGAYGELTVSLDITPDEDVVRRIDERTHLAAVASLRPLVAPRSVAVVGAGARAGSTGATVIERLLAGGFEGVVTAVDPSRESVHPVPAVGSLAELPEPPELVVTVLAASQLAAVAEQAAACGCKALLVLAGEDPLENGPPAAEDDERLLEIVRTSGMRMVGPHSLGILNTDPAVNLRASCARPPAVPGRLAVSSQSGAVGVGLLGHAAARGLGISTFISLGQRLDVSTNDLLELWEEDERTAAAMLYLETFGNPERFARVARRVSRRKPLLAVKGNRPPQARQLDAGSHTAAALRGDAALDALLIHAGVLRFRGGEELFNAAEFFESQPLPLGRRVGVVSNSGGIATLAVDACSTRGLVLGEVGPGPEEVPLKPPGRSAAGAVSNPEVLSIGVTPADYGSAVSALLADPGIDAVMAYYVDAFAGQPEAILAAVAGAAQGMGKPVVASVLTADGKLPSAAPADGQGNRRVPNFLFPEACATVIAHGAQRREWLARPLGLRPAYDDIDPAGARELVAARLDGDPGSSFWLSSAEAEQILAGYGISFTAARACPELADAVQAAAELRAPVALKADTVAPAHASDIDAVLLGLEGEQALSAGWRELERRVGLAGWPWRGALLEPLAGPGADLLIGMIKDPDYGPVVALGLGGRQAGLGSDATVRLPPTTDVEADELIDASASVAARLRPFRGQPPLDREELRHVLLRFARLLRDVPEILEADLNPTRWMQDGCTVLDVRIRVGQLPAPPRVKTW